MGDLTVIYLTVNRVPQGWVDYHRKVLVEAIGDAKVITMSRLPTDFGVNILQEAEESSSNIYYQMLRAARLIDTPYLAVAEDDVLYCHEHFNTFRPPMDSFGYNMTRWSLFSWGEPMYSWRNRLGNFALIAPTKLALEALEERFTKYPTGTPLGNTGELGKVRMDRALRLTHHPVVEWWSTVGIIQFSHDFGTEPFQRNHRKRMSMVRAYDIPYWGHAKEVQKQFA